MGKKEGEEFGILDLDVMGCYFDLFVQIIWSLVNINRPIMLGNLRCVLTNKQNSCFDDFSFTESE